MNTLNDSDLLSFALKNGMLDLNTIQVLYTENYIMEKHNEKIWQGSNGRWYTYVPSAENKAKRRLIAKSSKEKLLEAVLEFYNPKDTVESVFYEWLDKKLERGEIYKQTYDRYENDYKKYLKNIGSLTFNKISQLWLEDYIKDKIKDEKLTSKQWSKVRTLIYGIFKLARKKKLIDFSITEFMEEIDIGKKSFAPKVRKDEEQVFTDEEALKIISWIDNNEENINRLGIKFAFLTGLRAGELAALKVSDIDGNVIHLSRTEIRYKNEEGHWTIDYRESTKGKVGYRDVVLIDEAKSLIDRIIELSNGTELIFNGYTGLNFTQNLERICKRVGIKPRSMHKIRKTYCTCLINAEVPENVIKAQVGHVDIKTTKTYYYFNNLSTADRQKTLQNASLITQ